MDKEERQIQFDFEHYFELSPDLICIASFDGYFKRINPAVSKTLKYSNKELMERPITSFIHMEDRNETGVTRNELKKGVPLINFENRYITKDGETIWLEWTSVPIPDQQLIFAIAKNITEKKQAQQEYIISATEGRLNIKKAVKMRSKAVTTIYSSSDKAWLDRLETLVRNHMGKSDLNLKMLSEEMAIGERQLFRRIKTLIGITPNHYIRLIRLQIALEAIQTGKYRTVSEISHLAGFQTPSYFKKLFKQEFRYDVEDLL